MMDEGRRDTSDRRARDPAAPPPPLDMASIDQPTRDAYLAAMREYYRYRISGFQHRQQVFAWQHWSSKAIFAVVLALVGAGIYFAAIQFHRGLKQTGTAPQSEDGQITEFVASFKGIKVSSPVLGVIILVISLVFFYLYLAFVYPIREVF